MTNTPEETIKKESIKNKAANLIVFIIQRIVTIGALIAGIILMLSPSYVNNYINGAIFIMLWAIMSSINSLTDSFHKFSDAVCSALSAIMTFQRVTNENKTTHPLPNLRDIITKMTSSLPKGMTGIEFQMLDENGQPLSPEIIEEMKRNDPFFKMISKMKEDLESNPALKDIIERRIKKEETMGATDYKFQSKDGLDKMLKDAIAKEDYELAAVIQEEIKKRGA